MVQCLGGIPGPVAMGAIFLVVLLLFGAQKIPELMRSLGSGLNQFKKGLREVESEIVEKE